MAVSVSASASVLGKRPPSKAPRRKDPSEVEMDNLITQINTLAGQIKHLTNTETRTNLMKRFAGFLFDDKLNSEIHPCTYQFSKSCSNT